VPDRTTGDSPRRAPTSPTPAFPIRLIALDIDGTIVGEDLVLGKRLIAAVAAARAGGVSVSLVTGRMATSALVFARTLGLSEPLVAYQGALARAMPDDAGRLGRLLRHRPLDAAVAREVVDWTRARGLDPHVNHLERFIIRVDDPRAEDYSTFLGARAMLVPDLVAWIRRPVPKVLAVSVDPIDPAVLGEARAAFAGRASVTISHPRFLEFLAPGVSKGEAVGWLARRAGVPLANVLAIGDQYNDLEMIAAVGHGAAMPTAPEPVRAVARHVARPLADDGAAELIERLVLRRAGGAAA
jgi:hypothetical protein